MKNPKKYLNQPYRELSSKKLKWSFVLGTGLFIFIFLYVFKPSSYIYDQKPLFQFLISFGFGLIATIILYILKFLVQPRIVSDNWTLGKSIIWGLTISACIGIASYFYIVILFENEFRVQYLPIYIKYFFYSILTAILIGSIPITIRHLVDYVFTYRKALKQAGLLNDKEFIWEDEITIKAGQETNSFDYNPRNIVYISSDDNYISVFSLDNESLKKLFIRGTLKAVEKDLIGNNQFVRCHKSYIINLIYFTKTKGNSNTMQARNDKLNLEIPISRSKSKLITRIVNS